MANNLTESIVHYTKLSVNKWNGRQERYKVNQSLKTTTTDKMLNFTWHFTRQLREMWNAVEEDIDWEGFHWAEEQWRAIRKQYGRKAVLWVGKACHAKQYQNGTAQKNVRVPKTVSLLVYVPSEDVLIQMLRMEDWSREFEFHEVDQKIFNRVATWRNPLTIVKGGTAPGGW